MTNIVLTEEHKDKLFEMCKKLFYNSNKHNSYDYFKIDEHCFICGLSQDLLDCEMRDLSDNHYEGGDVPEDEIITPEEYDNWEFSIHWFEFCITWLSDKVIYSAGKRLGRCEKDHCSMLMNTMSLFYNEGGEHPIDFLYEQFKELK